MLIFIWSNIFSDSYLFKPVLSRKSKDKILWFYFVSFNKLCTPSLLILFPRKFNLVRLLKQTSSFEISLAN